MIAEYFLIWLVLAGVNGAAVISPGPAFAITVRNAIRYNRKVGVFTALGLALGVGVHVTLVLTGISVLLSGSPLLYNAMKYAGAGYLVFIGIKALKAKKHKTETAAEGKITPAANDITNLKALQIGFLTNALSPKALVFFTAVYSQFISPDMPWQVLAAFGLTSVVLEATWFSIVTVILTDRRIKNRFLSIAHWIERVCGGLMIGLGVKLAVSKGF